MTRRTRRHRTRGRGQAMLEFALIMPFFLVLAVGAVDFGNYYELRVTAVNALRDGARYGTTHPTAWSNAATAATNSIEGLIQAEGGDPTIVNDDSHMLIAYYDTSTSPFTECGYYVATSNSFAALSTYTQATCVKAGNEIRVQITDSFRPLVPLANYLPAVNTLVLTYSMLEDG
ncbi:MAG TPA: TadE/TadG family type IV pilus assembly protein [Candidatus Dormibacteraeota bacterium]|nr:TadE/TadG family type IV pilus assembly protein [Candidatus Dormibacteraeota bacterium]